LPCYVEGSCCVGWSASVSRGFPTLSRSNKSQVAAAATFFRPSAQVQYQPIRTIKHLSFGGDKETVYERSDYPPAKLQEMFKGETFGMIGYGTQGRGQALNARDQGMHIIVGLREGGPSWARAMEDGFVPGKTLFNVIDAVKQSDVCMYLLSDAGQKQMWNEIKPHFKKGATLYFAHGFSVVFKEKAGVIPPPDMDVVLVAPNGSGTTVRRLFLEGRGINASVAVHQDVSGKARDRAFGIGVAVGTGYMYETTFKKEVLSDLTGERGVLMGAINGMFLAQYDVLRENGHSPSEAFNETVEEATQSLYPLIGENGMDWMYANCSTTAQRGALDWYPAFKDATKPVFEKLYAEVKNGNETQRTLDVNSKPDYQVGLDAELKHLRDMEIWRAGVTVRGLRPERN
jgi:ketol-acid reductoisomerase